MNNIVKRIIYSIGLFLFGIAGAQVSTVSWPSGTGSGTVGTNSYVGTTTTVAGQTVTVTVTANTNTSTGYTYAGANNNNVIFSDDTFASNYPSNTPTDENKIKSALGVSDNEWFYTRKSPTNSPPTTLTFTFTGFTGTIKVAEFGIADINASSSFNETFVLSSSSGYSFDLPTSYSFTGVSAAPTITSSGLTYSGVTDTSSSTTMDEWIKYPGATGATISSGGSFTLTFSGAKPNTTPQSNVLNGWTLKLAPTSTLNALDDSYTITAGSTGSTSVLSNDTDGNNNTPAVIGTTTGTVNVTQVSTSNAGVTLNSNGTISVAAGTPAGTYTVNYRICEQTALSVCKDATAKITVPLDTDGDGIPDSTDLDDDNDGILDTAECGLVAVSSYSTPSVNTTTNTITFNAVSGSTNFPMTITRNSQNGYTGSPTVLASTVASGIRIRENALNTTNNDSFTYTISPTTTSAGGYKPKLRIYQWKNDAANTTGNAGYNEASTWQISWTGGGTATLVDAAANATTNGCTTYYAYGYPATGFDLNNRQIEGTDNLRTLNSGDTFVSYALTNQNATWYVDLPLNATNIQIVKVVLNGGTVGTFSNTCSGSDTASNGRDALLPKFGYNQTGSGGTALPGESSNEFLTVDVLLVPDTDNDGITNCYDLDSDGDNCPDAVEGGDNVTQPMLNTSNAIGTNVSGTLNSPAIATVDTNGVPVIVNSGSTYNIDGQAQGQTAGTAYTSNPLVAGVISATSPICSGKTSTISVTTAPQGATFQWQSSTVSDFSSNVTNLGSALTTAPTSYTTATLTSTTYFRLLVTSAGGCTTTSNIVTVTVNPIPVAPNIVTTAATCTANGTATIENYDATATYTFSPTGPTVGAGGVISGYNYATQYTVTATSNSCISSASSPFYVYAKLSCNDTDGDGVYDNDDLDDDNDGILDTAECTTYLKFSEDFSSYVNSTTTVAPLSGSNVETGYPYRNPSGNVPSPGGYAVALNANTYFGSVLNTGGNASIVFDGNHSNDGEKLVFKVKNLTVSQGKAYTFEFNYHIGGSLPGPTFYIYADPDGAAGALAPILINSISTTNTTGSTLQKLSSNWTATNNSTTAEFYVVNNNYLLGNVGRNWIMDDFKVISYDCDFDSDGIPNHLDLDSDNDNCPDAIEGGDNITSSMLSASNAIGSNVSGTLNSPAIATVDTNGVPVIVNSGSTYNIDGQAQGQTLGDSQNASVNSQCNTACYKPAITTGTVLDTNHGITALGRAGADSGNWPMVRKGAWTVLEAKTKGFVANRLTDLQISQIPSADLKTGMMVYNIDQDCLQINVDGTAAGWKCFKKQTCPN